MMWLSVMQLSVGLLLLIWASDQLINGAVSLATCGQVSPLVIGVTILGVGTSIPEVVMVIILLMEGQRDTAVGSILGSNIVNNLLILGSVALIRPLITPSRLRQWELPWLLGCSLLLGWMLYHRRLDRLDSVLLSGAALLFCLGVWRRGSSGITATAPALPERQCSAYWAGFRVALGLALLPVAAKWVVESATVLARHFGLSELVIGLTVIAIGSSLPELATAATGALKRQNDLVVGNIIGSNLFNSSLVMAIPAAFSPGVVDSQAFTRDYWVMLGSTLLLLILCYQQHPTGQRITGTVMLIGFSGYLLRLFYG